VRSPGTPVLVAVALATAVGIGVPLALASSHDAAALPDRRTAAVVSFPGLARPTVQPLLPSLTTTHPRPGDVVRASGPFDDRFTLTGMTLVAGTVTGTLTVTSDVSELIDLQVVVGFYDRDGALLGTGSYERHGEGARPDEVVHLRVAAPPAVRDRSVAAAVGVPVLVNE
jgi:hypothetical protein